MQITGEINSVKKALQSVSRQLLENPPLDHESFSVNSGGPSHPLASSQGASYAAPRRDTADFHSGHQRFHEGGMPGRLLPSRDMLTYRMLCYDERVGGVIGKGGAIIKALMQETGCEIKVLEPIPDSDDRLIIISGPAVSLKLPFISVLGLELMTSTLQHLSHLFWGLACMLKHAINADFLYFAAPRR